MTLTTAIMAALDVNAAPRTREMYEYVCRAADAAGVGSEDVHNPQLIDNLCKYLDKEISRGHERKAEQVYVVISHACPWMRSRLPRPRHRARAPRVLGEDEAAHTCLRLPKAPHCGWRWRWPCPAASGAVSCADYAGLTLISLTTSYTSATNASGSPDAAL